MYRSTGQDQLVYRVTPMYHGCCHLEWCLTGNVCGPRGTRPFVGCLRPEAQVRMRPGMPGMHGAVRGLHLESHGFPVMRRTPQMTREREAWPALSASLGYLVQNRI